MKTMGQAVDEAIAMHEKQYPESAVYKAEVAEHELRDNAYIVEVQADHFSVPLRYTVKQ